MVHGPWCQGQNTEKEFIEMAWGFGGTLGNRSFVKVRTKHGNKRCNMETSQSDRVN